MTREEVEKWHEAHPYGARPPEYMDAVLAEIKKIWLSRPHERLGQALFNAAQRTDLFHVWDEDWFTRVDDIDEEENRDQ